MPEYIKALFAIVTIAGFVFLALTSVGRLPYIEIGDFKRRRNAWLITTCCAFLLHSFWLLMICAGIMLGVWRKKEKNAPALFLWLLSVIPPFSSDISGFGVVNYLFTLDFPRLLSLTLLLPTAWGLSHRRGRGATPDGFNIVDGLLLSYVLLRLLHRIPSDTSTNSAREAFYLLIDIGLPYYVASRGLATCEAVGEACVSYAASMFVMGGIAMFEAARHWLLYKPLPEELGIYWGYGNYLARGALRAEATSGQPIVLGFMMVVAISMYLCTLQVPLERLRWASKAGVLWLLGGLVASLSRGPWVGAAVAVFVFVASNRAAAKSLMILALTVGAVGALVAISPWRDDVVSYLPFVGSVGDENVEYRRLLIDVTVSVIKQHPWFGSFDYLSLPEMQQLVQGEGIIDVVNTYIGVALSDGMVGLLLFIGVPTVAAWKTWRAARSPAGAEGATAALGRSLLAAIIGMVVTIGTTSSVTLIPVIYWTTIGVSIAYVRVMSAENARLAPSRR